MKKIRNKLKRKLRNRKKLAKVNTDRFRISINKSLNNLSAQIIDDFQRKTLVSVSSNEEEIRKKKVKKMEKSSLTGEILAKRAKEKNISKVFQGKFRISEDILSSTCHFNNSISKFNFLIKKFLFCYDADF